MESGPSTRGCPSSGAWRFGESRRKGSSVTGNHSTTELRNCLGVRRAFLEDGLPEPLGFRTVGSPLGERGKVAQGEMTVNGLVHTAKLLGTLQRQDPPPGRLGLGRLARHAVHHGLAKEQLPWPWERGGMSHRWTQMNTDQKGIPVLLPDWFPRFRRRAAFPSQTSICVHLCSSVANSAFLPSVAQRPMASPTQPARSQPPSPTSPRTCGRSPARAPPHRCHSPRTSGCRNGG
jgi:hypothetical protein